ncbi:MAG: hypothetical protein A3D92_00205 [Bacteroidetes bacterium RIFCSPHIGHO2_02_FULL_44_7]|nr:MAG: hypothetical protein A3D92_00205 [Bacteroidetes bacterium RIFCSPHIGHO2_02_FULL_44_7]
MKKWIFPTFIGLLSFSAPAQDSVSVLFIGNSYVATNNLPLMIRTLANSLGDEMTYVSQNPGGATLANHAGNPLTFVNINSQPWDFVVLQAQSQEPSFSDSQVNTQTLPYAMQIADSVYDNRFCSDVQFFMTWGRKDGDPQWAPISTYEGMNSRLRAAYMRMADSVQGSVSPVGSAWAYVRANYPSLGDSLYMADGSHPSMAGSYLAACTFYASLYRKTPLGSSYTAGLSGTTAEILQQAAALTVLDSLELWNVRPISEHTQAQFTSVINGTAAQFTNTSTKAQSYVWDFGDLSYSTDEHPTHSYAFSGSYQVMLITESVCDSDTTFSTLIVATNGLEDDSMPIHVVNLGSGRFQVTYAEDTDRYQIFTSDGKLVAYSDANGLIDLAASGKGLYFMFNAEKAVSYRLPYLTD